MNVILTPLYVLRRLTQVEPPGLAGFQEFLANCGNKISRLEVDSSKVTYWFCPKYNLYETIGQALRDTLYYNISTLGKGVVCYPHRPL